MMRYLAALAFAVILLPSAPAYGQQQPPPKPASQDEFVPVNAPLNAEDTIPAPMLVGTAYAFIWIVLFGYLWSIRSRLATVEREMTAIDRRAGSGRK